MSKLILQNISAGYGGEKVVCDLSFETEGGVIGILGPNGSGKSTLLKAIACILPHEGATLLGDLQLEKLSARQLAKRCGYIPQRSGISIDLPIIDMVLMGFNPQLGLLQQPGAAMREKAMAAIAMVGLAGREEESYLRFSEGQKQLCILARTLVTEAELLLLDEPESALDLQYRYRMLRLIREAVKQRKGTALVALHDPMLALYCCDRLVLIKDGRLLGQIDPKNDPTDEMEEKLQAIYGKISLLRIKDKNGSDRLVMLKEDEEA